MAAVIAGLVAAAIPALIFWPRLRHPDRTYPGNSEAMVLIASPLLAGLVFGLVARRPVFKRGVVLAVVLAVPLAVLAIFVLYAGDLSGLGPIPLALVAT